MELRRSHEENIRLEAQIQILEEEIATSQRQADDAARLAESYKSLQARQRETEAALQRSSEDVVQD